MNLGSIGKACRIRIAVGKKSHRPTIPATGGLENFQPLDAGKIRTDEAGDVTIHIAPVREE